MPRGGDLSNQGARDQYVAGMLDHQKKMANIKPMIKIDEPVKPFGGGKCARPLWMHH